MNAIFLKDKQEASRMSYELSKKINDSKINEIVFKSDGINNFIYLGSEVIAIIFPKVTKFRGSMAIEDITYVKKDVWDDSGLYPFDNKEYLSNPRTLEKFWRDQLFQLIGTNNNLIVGYILTSATSYIEEDTVTITYNITRTENWTEETPYINPINFFFYRTIQRSCTSGYIKMRESNNRKNEFVISMSTGKHSSKNIREMLDGIAKDCIEKFENSCDKQGISCTSEYIGTFERNWHEHEFRVIVDVPKIMNMYKNITDVYMYHEDKDDIVSVA